MLYELFAELFFFECKILFSYIIICTTILNHEESTNNTDKSRCMNSNEIVGTYVGQTRSIKILLLTNAVALPCYVPGTFLMLTISKMFTQIVKIQSKQLEI